LKKIKIFAFICALAVGFSLTGCADTSWAVKDSNVTIPNGVYLYYLLSNASTVQAQAANSSASSSTDIWSQKIENTNAVTWAMNNAINSCKQLAVIEKLSASRKVALTSDQSTSAKSYASSNYTTYSSLLKKNGVDQTAIERISNDMYLQQALFDSYYGAKGDKAVPESQIDDYYTKNYVHVKQIFVAKIDTSTYAALPADKLAAAKTKANEAYAKAKADVKSFDTFVKSYNEDTGEAADGYIFSKDSAANSSYDQKFTDLGFSLKEGEVGMAESDMGWFIEYKLKTDPKATSFDDSMKSEVLAAMKGTEFNTLITDMVSKETFNVNSSMQDKYSPKKLDLTEDTSGS
jgi:parvulin-like peptidyl-prolyl isomerase